MDHFRESKNTTIYGGRFTNQLNRIELGFVPSCLLALVMVGGGCYYIHCVILTPNAISSSSESVGQLLRDYVIAGSMHDAVNRSDSGCHKDTRVALLADIRGDVARSLKNATLPTVTWIHGPAGVGKSAIAQTLVMGWERDGKLAASFHFKRSFQGQIKRKFVTTIAYQLARTFPKIKSHLEQAIINDPLFVEKSLSAQAEMLVKIPLEKAYPLSRTVHPKIIVLDGLDEALDEKGQLDQEGQREILQAFVDIITKRTLPLRLLVFSRPERGIYGTFSGLVHGSILRRNMAHLDHDRDIQAYLSSEFKAIQRELPWLNRPNWPPGNAIQVLTQRSSGKFIYSTMAIRYIKGSNEPEEALQQLLNQKTPRRNKQDPYSTLDEMYIYIFSSLHPTTLELANLLMSTWIKGNWLIHSFAPLLTNFFALNKERWYWELQGLHSVVRIEGKDDDCRDCIGEHRLQPIHESLLEFIQSPSRSGRFHLGPRLVRSYITFLLLLGLQYTQTQITHSTRHVLSYGDWHLFMAIKDHLREGVDPLPLLRNCLANAHFEDVESYSDRIPDVFDAPEQLKHADMRRLVMNYLEDCQKEIGPNAISSRQTTSSLTDVQQELLRSLNDEERKCIISRPVVNIEQPEVDFCRLKAPEALSPHVLLLLLTNLSTKHIPETSSPQVNSRDIYSALVTSYLKTGNPEELASKLSEANLERNGLPEASIDDVYTQILSSMAPSTLNIAMDILSHWVAPGPVKLYQGDTLMAGYNSLDRYFALNQDKVKEELENLNALIPIDMKPEGDILNPFRIYPIQRSLLDYITDPTRPFYLDHDVAKAKVALSLSKYMLIQESKKDDFPALVKTLDHHLDQAALNNELAVELRELHKLRGRYLTRQIKSIIGRYIHKTSSGNFGTEVKLGIYNTLLWTTHMKILTPLPRLMFSPFERMLFL